ncbi:MAG TPA: patatin-like phospholipase family protein [Gemmatimonadales bacterium]
MPRILPRILPFLFVLGRSAAAQSPIARRDTQHISALLTISGGISLGSYEAGVNWGLLELFKLTAQDSLRRAWNLPRYELKAMAGASAGNINGFLAAVEWCRTREPVPPEQSLLWKIWVRTGFDQLFPLERYNQRDSAQALFSRRYFQQVLFDTVRATMRDLPPSQALDGCTIPVGVTITRLTPGEISISRGITAVTQRYATAVQVSRRGNTLQFRAPPGELLSDIRLGALLLLPDCEGLIAPDDVFRLIEASSAFPGAFSPVTLRHQSGPGAGCGAGPPADTTALFSDGGLFDNNPIDLVAGIYADAVWKNRDRPDPNALLVFIDPEALRGRLALVEQQRKREQPATGGISALVDLFAGAVPAARQYELQAFARLLARAPQVFRRDNIDVTNRRFVVVGQQLGAFAAFLGQPFREYDFYVGVYDALMFMAREGCREAQGVDSTCVAGRLRTLVETRQLDLGESELPREMLRALYAREYSDSTPTARFQFDPTTPPRELFLRALLQAHLALDSDKPFDNGSCVGDAVTRLLCRDGFREILARVAADSGVRAILDTAQRRPECAPENWLESPTRCDASQSLLAFVDDPERFMAGKIGLMLHQMWRVEQARRQAGEQAWTNVATLSEALYQSGIGYRYRRGPEPNTSSVPRGSGRGWIASLVPNYANVSFLNAAFEIGYRPTWHVGRSVALGLTAAPLHVTGGAATSIDRVHFVIGPTIHWKRQSPVFSGLETGLEYFGNWRRRPATNPEKTVWAVPVTAYLLADKLRIGVRVLPGNTSAVHGGKKIALTFGLADLNGLVYWMLRKS